MTVDNPQSGREAYMGRDFKAARPMTVDNAIGYPSNGYSDFKAARPMTVDNDLISFFADVKYFKAARPMTVDNHILPNTLKSMFIFASFSTTSDAGIGIRCIWRYRWHIPA